MGKKTPETRKIDESGKEVCIKKTLKPVYKHTIVSETVKFKNEALNKFQIMMMLRNKFSSYTQVIMTSNQTFFFHDKTNLKSFDLDKRLPSFNVIPIFPPNLIPFRFRIIPIFKDTGKLSQTMDSIILVNYL